MDGFRRYAHARVITDLKNMADYHEERTLKVCEKSKTKTRTTATILHVVLLLYIMLHEVLMNLHILGTL